MGSNPLGIIFFLSLLSLVPIIVIMTTSFIKISMVLMLTRESLGVQQIPPNIVIYGLSLVLSCYIMGPVYNKTFTNMSEVVMSSQVEPSTRELVASFTDSSEDVKKFLVKHSQPSEREFFYKTLSSFWTKDMMTNVSKDDFLVVVPAFMVSELTKAFKIGFLIYLPSVVIDIIVSNILMAMGMMMMSPVTISLPIKLLLFLALDGWSRLTHVLLSSYS